MGMKKEIIKIDIIKTVIIKIKLKSEVSVTHFEE